MRGYQYNEREILARLFPGPFPGYVVEIGAADGIDNSNSFELIDNGWSALLVEPNPGFFMDLLYLYTNQHNVKLSHYAISDKDCRKMLGLDQQCSSLVHKKPFEMQVQCVTLTNLLKLYDVPTGFEFLSIDCEGEDMAVLRSLDWIVYKPRAVCVEHSMAREDLTSFMASVNYKEFDRNLGNTFFVRI